MIVNVKGACVCDGSSIVSNIIVVAVIVITAAEINKTNRNNDKKQV